MMITIIDNNIKHLVYKISTLIKNRMKSKNHINNIKKYKLIFLI